MLAVVLDQADLEVTQFFSLLFLARFFVVCTSCCFTLTATARGHFASLLERRHLGLTLQIDEDPEVFDARQSSLHPLFQKR